MAQLFENATIVAVPTDQIEMIVTNDDRLVVSSTQFTNNTTGPGYTLRWSRFRKIRTLEVQLPSDGIVLLDGKSGIGKTSILEAISFVLYDDAGNTCYPRRERASKRKHDPTCVELTFPSGLTIYRQRRPNLLRVLGQGVDLTDDSAQAYLNRMFGHINSWLVGGYLRQRELCAFFSMSSDDKLSLLQKLSLSEHSAGLISSPEKFELELNKTLEKIILISRQTQETEMQVKVYTELYMRLYNQCPENIRNQKLWSLDQLGKYLTKYQVTITGSFLQQLQGLLINVRNQSYSKSQLIRSQISDNQIKIAQINEGLKQRNRLQDLLKENETQIQSLPEGIADNIHESEKELREIAEQINLAQRSERRSQLLATKTEIQRRFDLIPVDQSPYSLNDLDHFDRILAGPIVDQIDEQLREIALAKDFKQKFLIHQHHQASFSRVDALQKQLDSYPKTSVNDEIEDITKKIWALTLQQKKLTCPKCSADLQLNNGRLDILEECTSHVEGVSMNELQAQKYKYQQTEILYQQRGHVEKSLISAQEQLEKCPEVDLPPKPKLADYQVHQLDGLAGQLIEAKKARESLPSDLRSSMEERKKLNNMQDRIRLNCDIKQLTKELDVLVCDQDQPVEVRNLEIRRNDLSQKLLQYRSQENQRIALLATKDQLTKQLDNYPERNTADLEVELFRLQNELDTITRKSQQLEQDINAQMQVSQLVELYNQHDHFQKIHQEMNQRLMALQKIRATLITAEYIILDNVLSQLNRIISEVLDIIFIEPISVTIRSLRQLKTDDRIKPQINCQIIFDGDECSKISELSGGEQIRISLALAIAFSRFSNAPFLMLDESLSTLDVSTKESTIKMLRKYLPNKLIIAVNHDTTVGVYDSAVYLAKPGK